MSSDSLPIQAPSKPAGRVGVFGIGLAAYWEQFPGLKERLEGYQQVVETQMRAIRGQSGNPGRGRDDHR
jgi:L-arabinose isomerase